MSQRMLTDAAGKTMKTADTGGLIVPLLPDKTPEEMKALFDYIPDFKCRDDDVMLLSYPKTGTNWLYEVLTMLLNKSPERVKSNKGMTMLEFQSQENVDTLPAPRVINTHVKFRFLPKELKEKQIKTVLVARNPKDMMVSYYNHVCGIRNYGYDGEWKNWFRLYMQGEMEYGMYTEYLKEFEKAMDDGMEFPFHLIYYEDLKLNGIQEVTKLAKFLGVEADEELYNKIVDNCSFDNMRKAQKIPDEMVEKMFHPGFAFFRKGQIGDWKNWFTVAENEQFDLYWEKEMSTSKLKFTYSQKITAES